MLWDEFYAKGLTKREAEVADLARRGLRTKEVANQLFVTEKTIKFHLTSIYKKLNVKSRAQLVVWCIPHMSMIEVEKPKTETTPIVSADWLPVGKPGSA